MVLVFNETEPFAVARQLDRIWSIIPLVITVSLILSILGKGDVNITLSVRRLS